MENHIAANSQRPEIRRYLDPLDAALADGTISREFLKNVELLYGRFAFGPSIPETEGAPAQAAPVEPANTARLLGILNRLWNADPQNGFTTIHFTSDRPEDVRRLNDALSSLDRQMIDSVFDGVTVITVIDDATRIPTNLLLTDLREERKVTLFGMPLTLSADGKVLLVDSKNIDGFWIDPVVVEDKLWPDGVAGEVFSGGESPGAFDECTVNTLVEWAAKAQAGRNLFGGANDLFRVDVLRNLGNTGLKNMAAEGGEGKEALLKRRMRGEYSQIVGELIDSGVLNERMARAIYLQYPTQGDRLIQSIRSRLAEKAARQEAQKLQPILDWTQTMDVVKRLSSKIDAVDLMREAFASGVFDSSTISELKSGLSADQQKVIDGVLKAEVLSPADLGVIRERIVTRMAAANPKILMQILCDQMDRSAQFSQCTRKISAGAALSAADVAFLKSAGVGTESLALVLPAGVMPAARRPESALDVKAERTPQAVESSI